MTMLSIIGLMDSIVTRDEHGGTDAAALAG
jgi:hypothetical protein